MQSTEPIQEDAARGSDPALAVPAGSRRQAVGNGSVLLVLFGAALLAIGVIGGYLLAFGARGHMAAHASAAPRHRPGSHRGFALLTLIDPSNLSWNLLRMEMQRFLG